MMQLLVRLFFFFPLYIPLVLAHGEDKPGPHGGYIRMPGAFHTEVVPAKGGYRIYLLDIEWKNPTVVNSSVKATIFFGRSRADLKCIAEKNSFWCRSHLPQKGELKVKAVRDAKIGGDAIYRLPLKFEIPPNQMPEHSGATHQSH